ncbi:MAG: alpha-glucosidase C-terminal domain-containing protein [Bacteroidales bacterium]|nr:alpha-glucosidase C-terminal domain-containing protein [Bacteroidales bacterium]
MKNIQLKSGILFMLMIIITLFIQTSCKQNIENKEKLSVLTEKTLIHPEWAYNKNIYEVNIRQYSIEGNFVGFEKHLPRLKEMGVDILWLMPVNPIGEKNRKGTMGSYYSVKDYKKINPEFGTIEEFKKLVTKIHEMGMYVIIDWVANHSAWDNQLISDHPEWYTKDSTGQIISPVDDWTDVADFDYNNQDLQNYMIDALKFWVEEADIDGYRCDVAGMVPTEFWNNARKELDKIKPVFMLAEWETPELHKKAFDMSYNWSLLHTMNEIAKGNEPASKLDTVLNKIAKNYHTDDFIMNFTTNHDENSWNGTVYERYGDGVKTFAVLTLTIPGMPLIYSGQETGLNKKLSFFDKDTIVWNDSEMFDFYKTLLKLKKENKALWNGEKGGNLTRIYTNNDKSVFAFVREKDEDKIFVILNLSNKKTKIIFKENNHTGTYKNIFSEEKFTFKKETELELEPWEYLVFE